MMEDSLLQPQTPFAKRIAVSIAAIVVAGAGIGYAGYEHHAATTLTAQKQALSAQNGQVTAQLALTRTELNALEAKVNTLASSSEAKPSPETSASTRKASSRHEASRRVREQDMRYGKLQSELDAQGKEIADTRSDLANTRTELGGSIARTHDELVVLEKKGESNYFEFDIQKAKQFKHEGPVGISLRKANTKHQYADLMLMVDDRNLTQKHVNLYQPAMFYEPDSQQPIEIVINQITKDHIHGYVSAPKYRQSELNAMSSGGSDAASGFSQAANASQGDNGIVGQSSGAGSDQAASSNAQPTLRKRLTLPGSQASQQ